MATETKTRTEQAEELLAEKTSGAESEEEKKRKAAAMAAAGKGISEVGKGIESVQPSGEPQVGEKYRERFAALMEERKRFSNPGGMPGGNV